METHACIQIILGILNHLETNEKPVFRNHKKE